jgi:hypothetical protein
MFSDVTMIGIEADRRREVLLGEAREHRLASIARAGRRALRRAADEAVARAVARPGPPDGHGPPDAAGRCAVPVRPSAHGKVDADRR